jgi:hypothetical protein
MKGFYCGNFIHVHSVLWTSSPPLLYSHSPLISPHFFMQCLVGFKKYTPYKEGKGNIFPPSLKFLAWRTSISRDWRFLPPPHLSEIGRHDIVGFSKPGWTDLITAWVKAHDGEFIVEVFMTWSWTSGCWSLSTCAQAPQGSADPGILQELQYSTEKPIS